MNILIFTTTRPNIASGIVAYDFLKGLSTIEGNDVRILVREWDKYKDSRVIPIETTIEHYLNATVRRIKRGRNFLLKNIFTDYKTQDEKLKESLNSDYYFEYDISKTVYSTKKILKRAGFKPDLVLVLFMPAIISFKNLQEIQTLTGSKLFLALADMAPLTGGCHYAWDCKGYINSCGNCPALFSNAINDQSSNNFNFKKAILEKMNITVIAGSEWQARQLNDSFLFKIKKKVKILAPTNSELFCPLDKVQAKKKLGIPIDKKVILFGAVITGERRKGMNKLIDALEIVYNNLTEFKRGNLFLVIIGHKSKKSELKISFEKMYTGYLGFKELAMAYQSSEVFLCPSIEDSGPNMINQAIMSGTPVVSFEMGVSPDLVKNGETGYMAKLNDINDFANGILEILSLSEDDYNKMSSNCRKLALEVCDIDVVINKYQELISSKE